MSTFVKLVLRYFIFSSHEKFLTGITKPIATRMSSTLWEPISGTGEGLKLLGFSDLPGDPGH